MMKLVCQTITTLGAGTTPSLKRAPTDIRGGTHGTPDDAFIAGGSRFQLNSFASALMTRSYLGRSMARGCFR